MGRWPSAVVEVFFDLMFVFAIRVGHYQTVTGIVRSALHMTVMSASGQELKSRRNPHCVNSPLISGPRMRLVRPCADTRLRRSQASNDHFVAIAATMASKLLFALQDRCLARKKPCTN